MRAELDGSTLAEAEIPPARRGSASPALLQRRIRDLHLYMSMLFAPSLLFFAVTGALQLFDLHEIRPGRSFTPPPLLQELGMVHKKQIFSQPRRRTPPPASGSGTGEQDRSTSPAGAVSPSPRPDGRSWTVLALQIFFLLASLGLIASTCLGIWIGLRPSRNRPLGTSLFVAGAAIPLLLLML